MTVLCGVLVALGVLLLPRRSDARARREVAAGDVAGPGDASPREVAGGPLTASAVAECADLLGVALGGGAALVAAVEVVADVVGGEAGRQLRVVVAAVRWGVPPQQAWGLVTDAWAPVATAFLVADRAGVAPSALLAEVARGLRHAQARSASVRSGELSARIALPLGLTFLPGFVLTTIVPVVLGLARSFLAG